MYTWVTGVRVVRVEVRWYGIALPIINDSPFAIVSLL